MPANKNRPSRQDIRSSIIQSAQRIATEEGWEAVSVRKIADSIGYTAPIIYEYFDGKDELLITILQDSHQLLYKTLTEAAASHTERHERLRAIAMAYWEFAHARPELYRLMHGMETIHCDESLLQSYSRPITDFIATELIRFNPQRINEDNADAFMVEAWSMMHGLISLNLAGYVTRHADQQKVLNMMLTDLVFVLGRTD
jgi:AcrR family transcriptional regulator